MFAVASCCSLIKLLCLSARSLRRLNAGVTPTSTETGDIRHFFLTSTTLAPSLSPVANNNLLFNRFERHNRPCLSTHRFHPPQNRAIGQLSFWFIARSKTSPDDTRDKSSSRACRFYAVHETKIYAAPINYFVEFIPIDLSRILVYSIRSRCEGKRYLGQDYWNIPVLIVISWMDRNDGVNFSEIGKFTPFEIRVLFRVLYI